MKTEAETKTLLYWLPDWARSARVRASCAMREPERESIVNIAADVLALCTALASALRELGEE